MLSFAFGLCRRYREGERRELNFHFDLNGFRTVVVDLSTDPTLRGGLYVRDETMSASSERWVRNAAGATQLHIIHVVVVSK